MGKFGLISPIVFKLMLQILRHELDKVVMLYTAQYVLLETAIQIISINYLV